MPKMLLTPTGFANISPHFSLVKPVFIIETKKKGLLKLFSALGLKGIFNALFSLIFTLSSTWWLPQIFLFRLFFDFGLLLWLEQLKAIDLKRTFFKVIKEKILSSCQRGHLSSKDSKHWTHNWTIFLNLIVHVIVHQTHCVTRVTYESWEKQGYQINYPRCDLGNILVAFKIFVEKWFMIQSFV